MIGISKTGYKKSIKGSFRKILHHANQLGTKRENEIINLSNCTIFINRDKVRNDYLWESIVRITIKACDTIIVTYKASNFYSVEGHSTTQIIETDCESLEALRELDKFVRSCKEHVLKQYPLKRKKEQKVLDVIKKLENY